MNLGTDVLTNSIRQRQRLGHSPMSIITQSFIAMRVRRPLHGQEPLLPHQPPQVTGRPSRLLCLKGIIEHALSIPDVEFMRATDYVEEYWR